MKKLLFTFVLLPLVSVSQYTLEGVQSLIAKASEPHLVMEASGMLQEDYYYYSELVVDKLLTMNPESSNYNYRKGFIILDSRSDFEGALKYLEKAAQKISKNYDMYSPKEQGAPVDVYYHLGRCYHLNNQIDKAEEYYRLFLATTRKKSELIVKAQLALEQCVVARDLISHPRSAKVKNLNLPVNTEYPEYSPVISLDGKSLYFTSRRPWKDGETEMYRDPKFYQYPEDIYSSYTVGVNEWSAPVKMDFCIDNINEATIAVSVDERRIYSYQDVSGGGDIYYSNLVNNQFQTLENLNIKGVNTPYWETHCTVTPDGKNMYFVSNRPGGYGGRDIYRIVKLADGNWSEPINLGPTINTAYDEESPFIAIDNKTMYFASNGPKSMGGFDIFVAVRDEDNNWSEPINLGYPVNSTGDDLFYTTTVNGQRGYLSSFRKGGHGEKDIYEVESDFMGLTNAVVLMGNIYTIGDVNLSPDAHVIVKCKNCIEQESRVPVRERDGFFILPLEKCKDYELIFMENNSIAITTETFNTDCGRGYEEIFKYAYLTKYELIGKVSDKESNQLITDVKIEIIDKKTNKVVEVLTSDAEGKFSSNLLEDRKFGDEIGYEMLVSKKGYIAMTKDLSTRLSTESIIVADIKLTKMDIGKDLGEVVEINPIYFDLDKADIRPDAQIELDKIVQIMRNNPTIRIELGSHTDCRASAEYNLRLSDRRAKASADYIKKRIDNPARIYGKGYGETKILNGCNCEGEEQEANSPCTEEEHAVNRRTEFRIVKK